ncbi:MAG: hypothetical protein B6242_12300 [Anaerolineaceae bacterium 4572_78]|nr:MAG: hypothetical protein B6242_12300 [Anaerolineaceae bacterium 4572_78]
MKYLMVVVLLLTGCASTLGIEYDSTGRIDKITAKGSQASGIEQGDVKVRMDTKQKSILDGLISTEELELDI